MQLPEQLHTGPGPPWTSTLCHVLHVWLHAGGNMLGGVSLEKLEGLVSALRLSNDSGGPGMDAMLCALAHAMVMNRGKNARIPIRWGMLIA